MGKSLIIKGADFSAVSVVNRTAVSVNAIPSDGGTVTGGGYYNAGESITLRAIPNSGYTFGKWSDNNTNAERTVIVGSSDATYTATFDKVIPDPHTPIDYVKLISTSQYVQSPVNEDANTRVQLIVDAPIPSMTIYPFGRQESSGNGKFLFTTRADGKIAAFVGGSNSMTTDVLSSRENITIDISHTDVLINGTSIKGTNDLSFIASTSQAFYMMNYKRPTLYTADDICNIKFKSYKQWNGSTLVIDAVPVLREGIACWYNSVDNTYIYANGGSSLAYS